MFYVNQSFVLLERIFHTGMLHLQVHLDSKTAVCIPATASSLICRFTRNADGNLQPKTHVCPVTNLVVPYCPQVCWLYPTCS